MDKIFKATVIPNGIVNIAGADIVKFSVCIDIDHDNPGFDDSKPDYQTNVNDFYKRFLALSHFLSSPNKLEAHVLVSSSTNPIETPLSNDEYWKENCQLGMLEGIRETLWQNLFTAMPLAMEEISESRAAQPIIASLDKLVKRLRADVQLQKNVSIGPIDSLNDANTLYNSVKKNINQELISSLIDPNRVASKVAGLIKGKSQLINTLAQSTLASSKFKEVSTKNQSHFIMLNSPGLKPHSEMNMKQLHETVSKNYIDKQIDLNETFITYSQLSHHPLLLRLFGLVLDFSVPLDTVKNWGDTFTISLKSIKIPDFYIEKEWSFFTTNIAKITVTSPVSPNKYAFLPIPKDPSFFNCSILDDNKAYLINHDPMAQEQKLTAAMEKADQGDTAVIGEVHDSFTRGIIYNHPDLKKIIKPLDVGSDGQLYEEHISMGTRVVVKNRHENNGKWVSLTKRSTMVLAPDNTKVYDCGDTESCIHFDQVGNYMDEQTAKIHQKTSDALFEFKGEPLTLNTVFSRESKISKLESDAQEQANPPDQSTYNSQLRMNQYLDIDYFPFDKKVRPNVAKNAVKLRYSLPYGTKDASKFASLRFGQTYQFLVYNQYKNGWALPLYSAGIQASLDEIWNKIKPKLKNPALKFKRLENSKPVILFSQNPIGKAQQEIDQDFLGKDSLLHLVLRDAQADTEVFRHVLPERIALETAFWAGLLSQMTRDERHKWKCRYNYSETLQPWQTTPNDLDCSMDVGGTKMKDYYLEDVITSDKVVYIPDPVVDGFTIQLYWDQECTEQYLVAYGNEAIFKKENDYTVSSYGLSLMQMPTASGESARIAVSNANHKAVIYLKPGMKAYAKIYNHVEDATKRENLGHDYWLNQLHGTATQIKSTDFKTLGDDPKSQPLIVEVTNSSRKPIFTPELWEFWSRGYEVSDDNDQDLSYIQEWIDETVALLQSPDYPCTDRYGYLIETKTKKGIFNVDNNILGIRPQDNSDDEFLTVAGSSNVTFHMAARFERLDAISINNFLPGVSPTGALELWMRKEEFIDDPTQYVLPKKMPVQGQNQSDGRVNHFPDEPVYSLNDPKNNTYQDYKIGWSADTLQQLKNRLDPSTLGDYRKKYLLKTTNDPFQDTISQFVATYNTKTTKFELREYQLIDTSKYRGYYTDKKEGEVSDFQSPSQPFPVLLLGNDKPEKPSIAYLVTTIQRGAEIKNKAISTTQKGNIIAVYLNRGRLSSGRDERVGVLVQNGNEYSNIYIANKTISKTGKDVITDQLAPQSQFIRYDKRNAELQDIHIPLDSNIYDARYDENLSMVSYLPRFDTDKQLWKFEIEFHLQSPQKTQLHNPFVNLGFVHFQPFALDHNLLGASPDLNNNCRISDAETTTFCYLLPERNLTAIFHKPSFLGKWGYADISLTCDTSSFNYHQSKNHPKFRTNFILCVEGSTDKQFWCPIMSQTEGYDWKLMHPLVDYTQLTNSQVVMKRNIRFTRVSNPNITNNENSIEDNAIRYHHFRLRLVEVEWFKNETWEELVARYLKNEHLNLMLTDVLDIEDLRTRYVELIY